MNDCDIGLKLLELRRELAWEGLPLGDCFHASEDEQPVRDRVFKFLETFDFRVYAQVLEKAKAMPRIRPTKERFYQYAWLYLFRYCIPKIAKPSEELMFTTASIGTKGGRKHIPTRYTTFLVRLFECPVQAGARHSGPQRLIPACRSLTTVLGPYSASGRGEILAPTT